VAEKVADTVARYAMFAGGERGVVAVSGGPDSTCLLHVLGRLGAGLELVVAHVDHGLSDASEEVAAAVARSAAQAGYDVHVARATDLEGPNLHARARDFRYSFFSAIAEQEGATKIATGHTLDDRVETTIARLIRGGGTDALAGIRPVAARRVRPLIDLRRDETRAYCVEVGLDFVDDLANEDERFDRPRIRRHIVGAIESGWGEGAVRAVASSASRLAEDADALAAQADLLWAGLSSEDDADPSIALETLIRLPRALRRRLLERALGRVRDRGAAIDEVLDALDRPDRKPDARFAVAGGAEIVITASDLVVKMPSVDSPG